MRLLFIYYKYPRYPQGSYFQEFLNRLSRSVSQIYLLASRHPEGKFEKPENLKIFWLPYRDLPFIGELLFILEAFLKAVFVEKLHKVDLVNSIGPRGILAGWYLKRRYKIPLVCTIELISKPRSSFDHLVYFLSRFLLTKAPVDKFICWSSFLWRKHLKKWGIPEKKVTIIPAGVDTMAYHPRIGGDEIKKRYSPKHPLIVFAKPLYFQNTQAAKILVRSIALLKPKFCPKLLCGNGKGKKEVQALAGKLKLVDQIDFMPSVSFPQIPEFLAAADFIVLPFTYPPTTSRSLLEAMAMGKPIVTTSAGEIKRMLKDQKHALLVKSEPRELAQATESLIENKNLAKKLGQNARQLAVRRYSLAKIVGRTVNCFAKVIN